MITIAILGFSAGMFGMVVAYVLMAAGSRRDIKALAKEWELIDTEFNQRKDRVDDLGWILRRHDNNGWQCANMDAFVARIEKDIIDTRSIDDARDAANMGKLTIRDDTMHRLKTALSVVDGIRRSVGGFSIDWRAYCDDIHARQELKQREIHAHVITRIQIELEKLKSVMGSRNPDWAQAADILMPVFQHLFLGVVKHDILTKCREQNLGAQPLREFGEDIDCVMTDEDQKKIFG